VSRFKAGAYLIIADYLKRTSQDRVATELGYQKLGMKPPEGNQPGLFDGSLRRRVN